MKCVIIYDVVEVVGVSLVIVDWVFNVCFGVCKVMIEKVC